MPVSRIMSMQEVVGRYVPDGASACMGTALEALIPFATGHELIRQRRRDPALVGPISDILFDQLVAAGCARCIQAAWVGNVSAGLRHYYQRAVQHGVLHPIDVEDHFNLTIAAALQAGAMGAWKGFLSTPGPEACEAVRIKTPRLSEPLDYGA